MTQRLRSLPFFRRETSVQRNGHRGEMWSHSASIVSAGIICFAAAVSAQQSSSKAYSVIELDTLGKRASVAVSINDKAQSAGALGSSEDAEIFAAVWDGRGKPQKLQTPTADPNSVAFGINDSADVVGGYNALDSIRGYVRTARGEFHILAPLPGDNGGQALSINNVGELVGFSTGARGMRACLWNRQRQPVNLGALPGGTLSRALDVNNLGSVVGYSSTPKGNRAFLWSPQTGMQDLGVLPTDMTSEAFAINDAGLVVGQSFGPRGMRAFIWSKQYGMRDLGVLLKGSNSRATGVNNRGEVVGMSSSDKGERAFVWSARDGMRDLNALVEGTLPLVEAHAINDSGQIIASGRDSASGHHFPVQGAPQGSTDDHEDESPTRLYLLTPVTVPRNP
jgi:probable HAF family extracellular repeat protein